MQHDCTISEALNPNDKAKFKDLRLYDLPEWMRKYNIINTNDLYTQIQGYAGPIKIDKYNNELQVCNKPYWMKLGRSYMHPFHANYVESEQRDFEKYATPELSFPCFDCGKTWVEPKVEIKKDGRQRKVRFCEACLLYHQTIKRERKTNRIEYAAEVERVKEICSKWTVEDHVTIINEIIKPYADINKEYKRKMELLRVKIDDKLDELDSSNENDCELMVKIKTGLEAEEKGIVPEIDIELMYFVLGMDSKMIHELFRKFNDWALESDYANYAQNIIIIKIRRDFDTSCADFDTTGCTCKYFSEEYGEPGGFIRLVTKVNC